jgi:hypothetical protein
MFRCIILFKKNTVDIWSKCEGQLCVTIINRCACEIIPRYYCHRLVNSAYKLQQNGKCIENRCQCDVNRQRKASTAWRRK